MNAIMRRPASPYARRLARERNLALGSISGTGPGGRIVAADVKQFAKTSLLAVPSAPSSAAVAMPAVSAFTAVVDLQKLRALLAEFGAADLALGLDVMLIRAGALALAAVLGAAQRHAEPTPLAVAWETGSGPSRRQIVLSEPHNGLVSALHARLTDALASPPAVEVAAAAALSIRRTVQAGIHPTAMPLLPGYSMRLMVSASAAETTADCLLCFDASLVGEDDAAALLARFRDDLETPVRLLA